jgi:hypothetical protein
MFPRGYWASLYFGATMPGPADAGDVGDSTGPDVARSITIAVGSFDRVEFVMPRPEIRAQAAPGNPGAINETARSTPEAAR